MFPNATVEPTSPGSRRLGKVDLAGCFGWLGEQRFEDFQSLAPAQLCRLDDAGKDGDVLRSLALPVPRQTLRKITSGRRARAARRGYWWAVLQSARRRRLPRVPVRRGGAACARSRREGESGSRGTVDGRRGEGHGQDDHATFWGFVCLKNRRRIWSSFLCECGRDFSLTQMGTDAEAWGRFLPDFRGHFQ